MRKEIALALCTSAVCLLIAAAYYSHLFGRHPDYGELVNFDPTREGGHLWPDRNLLVRSDSRRVGVRWITNSKGFRNDREFSYEAPAGTYRILFLGDSFVDGYRTDQEATIGYLLERELNRVLPRADLERVEVLIAGHNNPTNAWYYFQEHGRKFEPDLVILGISLSNDLTWNSYGVDLNPVREPGGDVSLRWSGRYRQDGWARPDLLLPEFAYSDDTTLRQRRKARGDPAVIGDGAVPDLWPRASPHRVPAADVSASLGLYLTPTMPEIAEMYAGFEEALELFAAAVRREGVAFLVVILPIRIQVYESEWFRLTQEYALDEARFDLTVPNRRIAAVLEAIGVPFLDLLPAFRREGSANRQMLYRRRGDSHFNELGQQVAAINIARLVLEVEHGEEKLRSRHVRQVPVPPSTH